MVATRADFWSGTTARARRFKSPLREFLRTESGGAGIAIDGDFLERAARSPITLGVLVGYVAGKPLGIVGTALLLTWLSHGRLRPTAGWGAVAGAGASAGVGFTVSLFVATLAFDGAQLEEAKAGILAAPVGAAGVTWLVFRIIHCCRSGAVLPPCSAAQSRSSTSSSRSIPSRTTSAVRSTRW